MGVAGGLHGGVEGHGVRVILTTIRHQHGRQVAAAAEPALGRGDEAGVHVNRRNARADGVADQADPRREEARIDVGAGHVLGVVSGKGAMHRRDVDADLFEQPAVHHAHDAPAALGPLPSGAHEATGFAGEQVGGGCILQRLEGGMDAVAQMFEPGAGLDLLQVERIGEDGVAHGALEPRRGSGVIRTGCHKQNRGR